MVTTENQADQVPRENQELPESPLLNKFTHLPTPSYVLQVNPALLDPPEVQVQSDNLALADHPDPMTCLSDHLVLLAPLAIQVQKKVNSLNRLEKQFT